MTVQSGANVPQPPVDPNQPSQPPANPNQPPQAPVDPNQPPPAYTAAPGASVHHAGVHQTTVVNVVAPGGTQEHSLVLRFLYFLVIGWWLGLMWYIVAAIFGATFIGLPLTFWMLNRMPTVCTLKKT